MSDPVDKRTANQVLRQWDKLEQLKRQLVRAGLAAGDATPAQIIAKVREIIPPDIFAEPSK